MSSPYTFDMGHVLYSEVSEEDGYHENQVSMTGGGGTSTGAVHFPYGVFARAPDPDKAGDEVDPAGATTALYWHDSNDLHMMPLEDSRAVDKLPLLKKGETIVYAQAGQFIRLHESGTISFATSTKGGALEGDPVTLQIKPDGLYFTAPWGRLVFDKTGFHAITTAGARLDLSPMVGLGLPGLDSVATTAILKAGAITLNAPIVSTGPTTGIPDNAVKATPLEAYLTALNANVAALSKAVGAIAAGLANTPAASAATAASAALTEVTATALAIAPAVTTFKLDGRAAQMVT